MIESRKDYIRYLEADRLALGIERKRPLPIIDEIWRFERLLRKTEYHRNCSKTPFGKMLGLFCHFLLSRKKSRYGFSIPINVFGPGLSIAHFGSIVVNGNAHVGKNCRIQESTTIGATNGSAKAPIIGDNCFIGSGARIIGDIILADDIAVGANAVVVKSCETSKVTLAGVPAKVVSHKGSANNLSRLIRENDKQEGNR